MKKISICFVLSFVILFIASQFSYAEPWPPIDRAENDFQGEGPFPMMPCDIRQPKGMPEFINPHWLPLRNLKLSDKQKEALKEIENSAAKDLIRKNADEQIAEIELRELLDKDSVDLKAVETKLKEIAAIKTETRLIMIKSVENIKAELTSEQRETLKKARLMDPPMRPPLKADMMRDETKMHPPSAGEQN
ncbi:MAG TPA: periplasmic heavy metal sensor [Smithella sp.]|nr:periplasmic heavy metal sensor [Smithella sp.]